MSLVQKVFDAATRKGPASLRSRLLGLIARRSGNLVAYDLDGVRILFPASHSTPYQWAREPGNSKSLGRVARIVTGKYARDLVVDLGANIGDSAAIVRSQGVKNRIIAVEGMDVFFDVLKRNAAALQPITLVKQLVSSKSGATLVNARVLRSGNAVITHGRAGEPPPSEEASFASLAEILSQHAPGERVCLLKTDIEGHDMPVVLSSLALIEKDHPVIFIELHVSDDDEKNYAVSWRQMFSSLRALGYESALYWRNSAELTCVVRLDDEEAAMAANEYYRNRLGLVYADVCLLHRDDAEMVRQIVEAEAQAARG